MCKIHKARVCPKKPAAGGSPSKRTEPVPQELVNKSVKCVEKYLCQQPALSPFQEITKEIKNDMLPSFLTKSGPKQAQASKVFLPGLVLYGIGAGIALVYMTDWRVIVENLPYYNGKFRESVVVVEPEEEPTKKQC